MSFNQYKRVLGSGTSYLSTTDLFVEVNTLLGVAIVYLPKISELFDLSAVNNIYNFNGIRFTDLYNNAAINNIILKGKDGDLINGLSQITLDTNGVGGILTPISETGWSLTVNNIATGSGGTIIGGGTLNYLAKYTPDGITINNSLLYDDGTSVGIGTNTPDASALLDLNSTTQGFAAPRMTTLQRDAIVAPIVSLLIFNTSSGFYNYWDGSAWIQMDTSTGGDVSGSGTTNYATMWTDGLNSVIGDGTWYFSGNDYLPVTTGANIGDATHRIGTIFMASVFDYANDLNFYNGTSNTMILTTGGQLGIGITPTSMLDILVSGSGTVGLNLNTSSTQDAKIHFRTNNSASARSQIYLEDATQTLNVYTVNNDTIFWNGNGLAQAKTLTLFTNTNASFEGKVGIGKTPTAKLDILQDTVGTGVKGLSINFNTIGEVFYIDDNGAAMYNANAGFTMKGSNGILNIISNGGVNPSISFKYNNGSSDSGLLYGVGAGMFLQTPLFGIGNVNFSTSASLHIQGINDTSANYALKVDNSASSPLLYVRNDGKVGIGTSTPSAKLDVNGQVVAGLGGGVVTANDSPFYAVRANAGSPNYYSGFQYVFEVGGGVWGIGMNYANNEFQFLTNGASTGKFIFGYGNPTTPNGKFIMDLNGGYFGANTTSPTATIHAKGIDATSSNYALKVDNSAFTHLLYVKNDGEIEMNGFTIRQLASATYFKTSGTNGYVFNNASDSTNLGKISNTGQILFGDLTDANYVGVGIAVKALSLTSNGSKEIIGALFKSNTDQDGVYFSSKQGAVYVQSYSVNTVNQSLILGGRNSSAGTLETLALDSNGNVGIGTLTPATSALLDLTSTTGALLVPRMTTTQKNALTAVNGMIIYDTTLDKFQGYEAGAWTNLI